ncbi:monoamine oxidase [Puia dinghuensis]|uniref:Tryptophan 2-monooxygenase n=2 Tax=Puia dinghuensis TaxID=1792502 RepID=A0A8J2UHL2_9BACT|nr:monoamine oxidase [Puia dinghuensis]
MGLVPAAPAHPFRLEGSGDGKEVVILGAGLAGMAAAYELDKLGYRCTILEARERTGGRCWSVRKGATNEETGGGLHTAGFDAGQYFNAGPSRIPHHHGLTLHYCKELSVPIQVYNNVNENTYYYSEGKGPLSNKKVRVREAHSDVRGWMAELLAKAMDGGKIDVEMSKEDTLKVIEYLRAEGGLDIDKLYKASARRGYSESPGPGDREGKIGEPMTLLAMLQSGLLDPDFYNVAEYTYELQGTLFQAVGGMDRIAAAFEQKVGRLIRMGSEVRHIRNLEKGVQVGYKDKTGEKTMQADLCICTIPLPVLSNIDHNFSSDASRAIDSIVYMSTGKIGLQFKRRFWEEDEGIYGGITHTNNQLTQIFYPSYDYLGGKGILIGYYNFNEKAVATGNLTYEQREQLALEKGSLIHPQYRQEFERSFSVSWHKTKYNMGGWALYSADERQTLYKALLQPDKQVYFAGEHMTYLNAWMAGALESARSVVAALHSRVTGQRFSYPVFGS